MNNLPEIRDIYIPDNVSVFPLAYGWWIIIASFFFFILFFKLILWSIRKSKKHYAKKALEKIELTYPISAAIEISNLLRRICNLKYKEAKALYGKEWIDFLNQHSSQHISGNPATLLMSAPFMKQADSNYTDDDIAKLKDFSKNWIGENL